MDTVNKEKGRQNADKDRGAKDNNLKVGDKVLLQNVIFPNKLTPTFGSDEFEVVERKGNDVIVRGNDKVYRRNISHLKKLPIASEPSDGESATYDSLAEPLETHVELEKPNPRLTLKLKNIGGMWRSGNTVD